MKKNKATKQNKTKPDISFENMRRRLKETEEINKIY